MSRVLKEVSKSGARGSAASAGRRAVGAFGRGRVAAGRAGRHLDASSRRVVIKSRFVVLKRAGARSVSTHLRYLERDGVSREGQVGQAYGPASDAVDLKEFEARGRGDRHQFRFIVSIEDAGQLEDLKGYTREFMRRMGIDLETPLDWVAVDHWDTDNPHTHIVLRGRAANGQDLVIAPDYMARGMRARASELATEWLGPRTELEIRQALQREVDQERLTSLDRVLRRQASMDRVDLTDHPERPLRQPELRGRLQRLEAMGLAQRIDAHRWQLSPRMEATLTAMGERGDILRAMHRALQGQQRDSLVTELAPASRVVGRIAAKGLADELGDRAYLVVDALDGQAHYVRLPAGSDVAAWPVGGIVEVQAPGRARAVDHAIVDATCEGIYRTDEHLAALVRGGARDPQASIEVHVRRLEALRRAGIAERVSEGVWHVPHDLVARAQAHDVQRPGGGTDITLRSHLDIERQVRAPGATWLDTRLVAGGQDPAAQGFGAQVRDAVQGRVDYLAEIGLAERQGRRVVLARGLLGCLRERELSSAGQALQDATGLAHRPLRDGARVNGVYRQSVQLISGRFAMVDDGTGFSLVPWRPIAEQRLGQQVSVVVRGLSTSWDVGRQRGPSR